MGKDVPAHPVGAGGRALGREYLEALLIALVFAIFARTFLVQAFKIPSGSMEQTLLPGDHILVNKFVYGAASPLERLLLPSRLVRRGDVLVFKFPLEPWRDFIKRCVALPGDTVELVDRQLYVNGEEVAEAYTYYQDDQAIPRSRLAPESHRYRDTYGPYTVPEGNYFCLGDNRDNSQDSRYWGPVPASHVKGRALVIYWSVDREPTPPNPGLRSRLRQLWRSLADLPAETRWERSFHLVR